MEQTPKPVESVVAIFDSRQQAEVAVKKLHTAHFCMRRVSIVARNQTIGVGVWGLLAGRGFFLIPGLGSVLVAGELVSGIVAAMEAAPAFPERSALMVALCSHGIPEERAPEYENAVLRNQSLLLVLCLPGELGRVKNSLRRSQATGLHSYLMPSEPEPISSPSARRTGPGSGRL